ncbi:monocarboxylate transporter 12-B-like isoform X1 [Paramacrobiotus metropolitanus]|uniref:monocarboxylate transporter 12-B-like isoform X1 n=1 Tax=Paramacrobiotus metropolitanus TaxID=2943436 RepID=UPI0024464BA3|nr:monocarboxylate transporter 12-B-like isoform X1 [Paramacrobiotus metropolitanus]
MKTALKGLAAKIQPNETNRPCFCGSTMANYLQLMDISENDQLRPSPLIDFGPLETLDPFASPTASAGTRACHQKTAWRVVVAAVYCCFIVDGIAGSIELIIYKYSTINVGSLVNGVLLVVAPVACVLADKFGYRLLLSIGPITASTGIAFGYFANDDILMATSAVIAGMGLGLIYSPTIIYVTAFFNGKGALAVGIVMSGSRMGGIVFSFFTGYLLEHVNRHEVLLVLSGICMLCFPICHAMTQQTLPYTEPLTSGKQSILRIYHNHALLLYTLAILSGAFAFLVPVNFLKDLPAVANSTMQLRFAVLVALMCADIIGKIVWNVCLDHTGWNPLKLHNVCIFFCGASMFMMSLCQDIWKILILTIANAFCAAPFISFATVILTKLLDVRQLPVAYGQIQLMSGIAHFVVPFLAAYINSRAAILSAGGLWMIATLIATLIFFLPRQAPLSEPVPDQEFKLSVM